MSHSRSVQDETNMKAWLNLPDRSKCKDRDAAKGDEIILMPRSLLKMPYAKAQGHDGVSYVKIHVMRNLHRYVSASLDLAFQQDIRQKKVHSLDEISYISTFPWLVAAPMIWVTSRVSDPSLDCRSTPAESPLALDRAASIFELSDYHFGRRFLSSPPNPQPSPLSARLPQAKWLIKWACLSWYSTS